MNLHARALVGLLCIGLATAQLNYRPEFISAGQGFRAAASYAQSKATLFKRQAPQGGGDPSDVIPHDQKKQTTFWWVAPDAPFKATKIGGGVQDPPAAGAGGDQAGAGAGTSGTSARQVGGFGATRTSQSSFSSSSRSFGATGAAAGTAGTTGAAGQTNQFSATATRTTGTQTNQGAGQVGAFGSSTTGGTTISRTSTFSGSTRGSQGIAGTQGTASQIGTTTTGQSSTRTTSTTSTGRTTSTIGTPGQPGPVGGLTTTSQTTRTQQTTTTGVAPVPVPQTNTATTTNTNTQTSIARTNTVSTSQNQQPPPTGTAQTNTFSQTTNTATTTGTRTGIQPPSPGSGTTVTNTQQNTESGRHSTTITSGVRVQPFLKKTTTSTGGYDYPVPLQVPCYEANKVCVPNQFCVNEFVDEAQAQQVASNDQSCNSQTETCCRIRPAPPPPQATQCPDDSYVCVAPSLCNNGLLNFDAQNAISSQQPSGQCFAPDVCCKTQSLDASSTVLTNEGYVNNNETPSAANDTPAVVPPPRNPPPRPPTNNGPPAPPPLPPIGCSAAMNCTEAQYCSSTGIISKTPVNLTPEQELFRVPVTECRSPDQGFTGVCCRDPDYVDPWPVGMLGLYNPELLPFDDGSYKPNGNNGAGNGNGNGVQRNENIQASQSRVTTAQTYGPNQITAASQTQYTQTSKSQYDRGVTAAGSTTSAVTQQQTTSNGGSKRFTAGGLQFVHSGNTKFKPFQKQTTGQCAPRNYNTQPRGAGQWDTGFGEFPWQAMVIYEPNKSLLCGGAIIKDNIVVTAAKCVSGLNPRDIMIKGGEWRLGVDAEPKTFQIVRVKDVIYHPAYEPQTLNYDVAMLVLEDRLRFDTHIGAICLDENDVVPSASYDNCVTTGWGREVLRIHIGNALMRQMPISLLSEAESQRQLSSNGFAPESHICGRPAADACDTDIGSALACADTSGTYYLKGVYSADNGCGRPDQIVSFSNIDVQWIKQALKNPNAFITPQPNYQTAANSPVISTVQQPSTLGPNYGKAYLPPYK